MADEIATFEQFWPHYVRAHTKSSTRKLHFVGTTAAVGILATGVLLRRPSLLLLAPVVGYGCAWAAHYLIEGNKPATFGHPLWSLKGDFVMWKKMVEGSMDAEVERILRGDLTPDERGAVPASPQADSAAATN